MDIGVSIGGADGSSGLESLLASARAAEAAGVQSGWLANIFAEDAITALAVVGHAVPRLGLGTAVVPTYPRHPVAMAQQALTAAAATGNRFTLGIGLSHKLVIEDMFGLSYDRPALHMREYLQVLGPLLRGERVSWAGEQYRVNNVGFDVAGAATVPLVVAALGPVMLRIAGELADGTATWMVGPRTLEEHIIPGITAAATAAGRPTPRVVAGVPVVLTDDPDGARAQIAAELTIYGQLPSYRAMLDREGASGPADVAIVGDEQTLRTQIERLRNMGVTDFQAAIVAADAQTRERTLAFLGALAAG